MDDLTDERSPRCGFDPPTAEEKDEILAKPRISRVDFCRLNNCTDIDYMDIEVSFQHALQSVVPVQLDVPIEGFAEAGGKVQLFMLVGGDKRLKTLWSKAKAPFEIDMRKRFKDYFKHIDAIQDSTKKSHHPGEQDVDIVVLSNEERDKLLHKVWVREADKTKDGHNSGSPEKKRRRVIKQAKVVETEIRTGRQPNHPRLWNSVLKIYEVTPAEITNQPKKTTKFFSIPFARFCDDDDYNTVSKKLKPDLDPQLFSCKKFCEIINKGEIFDLKKGHVAMVKARRRCDREGDPKHQWAFQSHREQKAEYYLEKFLQQMMMEAALAPNYQFVLFFKDDKVWEGKEMETW